MNSAIGFGNKFGNNLKIFIKLASVAIFLDFLGSDNLKRINKIMPSSIFKLFESEDLYSAK